MQTVQSTFTTDDIVVYLLLVIATMLDIVKINAYLYTLFLIIGITVGIITIVEKIKRKK